MELSDEQRKELEIIRHGYDSILHGPVDGERRPAADATYMKKQRRLKAFARAWHKLDVETQWDVVCGLWALWAEVERQPEDALGNVGPPDAGLIIERLLNEMKRPNGGPESYRFFGDATLLLWTAYCQNRPPWVKIGKEACAEIGAVVADIFDLEQHVAQTRVMNWLNEYEKDHDLTGRQRPPKSRPFP
jgi:hypothetical protein